MRRVGTAGPPRAPPSTTGVTVASSNVVKSSLPASGPRGRLLTRPRAASAQAQGAWIADGPSSFHPGALVAKPSGFAGADAPRQPVSRGRRAADSTSPAARPGPTHRRRIVTRRLAPMTPPEPSDPRRRPRISPGPEHQADPSSRHHHPRPAARRRAGGRSRWPRRSGATPSARIAAGQPLVERGAGLRATRVLPQLENAVLAGHDVILLGERGQAKTRIIRSLVGLLDEWLPIVAHSEINDDPYHPISRFAKDLLAEAGDDTAGVVGAPQRPLRREAGHARHLDRRPHRRGRPHPGGRGPLPLRRADHPLRAGAPAQPGHLRRQRAPRPGRADPGRACSTCSRSGTCRSAATGSGCRSTSCWWPRPTPRTTPTGAGSSPR